MPGFPTWVFRVQLNPTCLHDTPGAISLAPVGLFLKTSPSYFPGRKTKFFGQNPAFLKSCRTDEGKLGSQRHGLQTSGYLCVCVCVWRGQFLIFWSVLPPSPLEALLNSGKAPTPHIHVATLSQEACNNFFFLRGNALLPSLQNNVFIIAKPFPSLRRKSIPHDYPKQSGPRLQIQYVNSFVNIYSG